VVGRRRVLSYYRGPAKAQLPARSLKSCLSAREKPFALVAFTISDGRIAEIDVIADPAKLPDLP